MALLDDLFARAGGPRRVLFAVVGLGTAGAILMLSRMATAPQWVPAMSGVPLENTSILAEKLDQAGVRYKLERGGSEILVAEPDLAKARVTLAKDGMPGGGRPGLELFDRPSWGWNDFTQRINYRRALEGELERTISKMRGIQRAEVHLALSEQTAFAATSEKKATASVMLVLRDAGTPNPEVVRGIAALVSSSVDGLMTDNVSIHDETGRQWTEPNDATTPAGMTSKQLRIQQEVEQYLESKASDLVAQVVGNGNARVQVSAVINFDKVERTTQSVDAEKQALTSETKSEIIPGAQGGAAQTNVANQFENSKSTETFSGAIGNLKRISVAVLVNDRRLPARSATDSIPQFAARTPDEIARIETLVRGAVGADSARGDNVSVVSVPFEVAKVLPPEPEVPPTVAERVHQYQRPVLTGVGLVLAFI
ncbi:MAG: flagellar M-ring protein FliF, partial [Gemmatimonadaceae bacterium]|nr:flagellar M-ring protein FliF [Gemmatimonadaceae bacterium]